MSTSEVLIVGGGLAGLCCARRLHEAGVGSHIIEASDRVGGRVRTDERDGFRLDRGFQVLLTEYAEAKRVLNYGDLQLKRFEPGALIRFGGQFHRLADPWRRPRHFLATALSPVASFADKLRLARLQNRVCRGSVEELRRRGREQTTYSKLVDEGFSDRIIERFFKPFLGGVFLESDLNTSSRKFDYVFRMFSQGEAAVPANGMGAIAEQLAAGLPSNAIRTNAKALQIGRQRVQLESGEELTGSQVVMACEAPVAAKLLGEDPPSVAHGVTCIYFSADSPPVREPILVLNGEGRGPINNLCVPSQLVPKCAPPGKALISVTVLGTTALENEVKLRDEVCSQLREWYGPAVDNWGHLKTFKIPIALPNQNPPCPTPAIPAARKDGIICCGDYLEIASIQGAMVSGRRAAEHILGIQ